MGRNQSHAPVEIVPGVHWVGALDPDLPAFDLVMPLESGTTYNSYLILDEKITLIDTVKKGFGNQLLENISCFVDPSDIDYIVMNHFEQDHAGCLLDLLEVARKAEIILSRNAVPFLKGTIHRDVSSRTVDDNTEIPLGKRQLRFTRIPFLHWPDTMVDYLLPERVLFTCDAFGFHYCELDETRVEKADWNLWYYYDLIMRPFKEYVAEAVEKIKDLEVNVLCPSHGPVRRREPRKIIEKYREWSTRGSVFARPTVLIVHASFYGNTARLAEEIARGVNAGGLGTCLEDISLGLGEGLRDRAEDACGLLLGTPTMAGSPLLHVWDLFKQFSLMSRSGKPAGVFGSFGWNAAGIAIAQGILKELKFKVDQEPFKVKLVPTEEDLKAAFEFGRAFSAHAKSCLESKRSAQ
jgi:flavorubredoxin